MQRKKRLLSAVLLICALCAVVLTAVGIYKIYNRKPAQSAENTPVAPEIEGVSQLYIPGAPLVPPAGDFTPTEEFS